jgi:hypothetical protein
MRFNFIFLLLFIHTFCFSQNDSSKLKLNLSIGGNYTGGNFNLYNLFVKSSLSKSWKDNEVYFSPNFQYSQISNDRVNFKLREREIYYNLSYTKRWDNFRLLVYNEFENSFLRKVDFRGSMGMGAGVKIFKKRNLELDVSEMVLPEFLLSNFGNNFDNFALRLSTRLKFVFSQNNFKLSSVSLFQPSLYTVKNGTDIINFKDNLNLRSLNSLEYSPLKWFSIGINNEVIFQTYSNSIDSNVSPIDYNISVFFRFKN